MVLTYTVAENCPGTYCLSHCRRVLIFIKKWLNLLFDNNVNFQIWTRTRITTNSNFSQPPNKCIIQNFKNWKPLEASKYKKHDQIWTKITTQNKQPWENQQKRREKKEGNVPKKEKEGMGFGRLPSFFFPPFLLVFLWFFVLSGDFGPNLVVFFVFWGFERFSILEILN